MSKNINISQKEASNKAKKSNNDLKNFSEKLKQARKDKGYSQEDIANLLDISRATYINWENGSPFPQIDDLVKICDLLDCDVDYLLGRIDEKRDNIQITRDVTGLSKEAIQILGSYKKELTKTQIYPDCDYKNIAYVINRLLTDHAWKILRSIGAAFFYGDDVDVYKTMINQKHIDSEDFEAHCLEQLRKPCMKVATDLYEYLAIGKEDFEDVYLDKSKAFALDYINDCIKGNDNTRIPNREKNLDKFFEAAESGENINPLEVSFFE